MAESLKLPAPVVGRDTGFEEDGGGLPLGAELEEGGPGQPLVLADLTGSTDTATSRTSLATSTAMVVDCMEASSFTERSGAQGDSGTSDAA